ncbi:MAG: M90 family metallopeptidase, partial [Gammaproteobacteria bacterium]
LEYYHGFYALIVYADAFYSRDAWQDDAGVLHTDPDLRAGEAWGRGPVIVSWADITRSRRGHNVIIHEMAHKLDMLDGDANGRPPLHKDMNPQAWTAAFSEAYARHVEEVDAGIETEIDAYAATDPAEFFAVTSEVFFEAPEVLRRIWPQVYAQLALYYRQGDAAV